MSLKLIIVWGVSGAGKDETSKIIQSLIPAKVIKFARPIKASVEQWCQLPPGSLDLQEYKAKQVVSPITGRELNITYGKVLENFHKHWQDILPEGDLTEGYVYRQAVSYRLYNLIFNDMRKKTEPVVVQKLITDYNYDPYMIHVEGRGLAKGVDMVLSKFQVTPIVKKVYQVNNSGSLDQLREKVELIIKEICEQPSST